jgi:hypothetical protein
MFKPTLATLQVSEFVISCMTLVATILDEWHLLNLKFCRTFGILCCSFIVALIGTGCHSYSAHVFALIGIVMFLDVVLIYLHLTGELAFEELVDYDIAPLNRKWPYNGQRAKRKRKSRKRRKRGKK